MRYKENENAECSSCTAESGEKKSNEVILPHSLEKSKIEDGPESYINMTKVLLKLLEVVACFDGRNITVRMEQNSDPHATIECMIDGHAYSVDFSKKLEF